MTIKTRRVVTKNSTGYIQVMEEPIPKLEPGKLLIRTYASLISAGTELSRHRGRDREPGEKMTPFGYQSAGEVMAVGEGCKGFEPGQRVVCMGGQAKHSDYAVVPQNLAAPLPDTVSFEEGAFVALAATAMQAVRRGDVVWGEEIAVFGLGIVGQLVAQIGELAGARVLAFDPMPLRVDLAKKTGIALATPHIGAQAIEYTRDVTEGHGLDCAFLCVGGGVERVFPDVYKMMKRAPDTHAYGRIVSVGGDVAFATGASLGNVDVRSSARTGPGYHDPEYELGSDYPAVFVRWSTQAHIRLFVRLVEEGKLNVKDLATTRVPVEDADQACYGLLDEPDRHLGVIITYN